MNKKTILQVYGIFTLILFLGSIVYPFLQVSPLYIHTFTGIPGPKTFWSFRVTTIFFPTLDNPGQRVIREYWFADYWTQYNSYRTAELGLGIGSILAFMFGVQVLTVVSAALAISKVKPYLFLSSAIFNVCAIVSMWLTSRAFTYYYRYSFQAGLWLAVASAALFLAGSVLSWNRISSSCLRYLAITMIRVDGSINVYAARLQGVAPSGFCRVWSLIETPFPSFPSFF